MFNLGNIKISDFNLTIMKSDIVPDSLSHFFSTRIGGNTPDPLATFPLSAKDYTDYDNYANANLKIACKILGGNYENLLMPNQQHTDNIAIIKSESDAKQLSEQPFDAVITNLKNFPVCLVFADCVPVLIYDYYN